VGHGDSSVVARGKSRCDATLQLVDFFRDFVECGPCVEGALIGREGFRLRETGGMVRGRAGDVVGGSDEHRVRRPASHNCLDFVEGSINIIVRSRWRGERSASGLFG